VTKKPGNLMQESYMSEAHVALLWGEERYVQNVGGET
jgi:hypothetical protein